ncbi:PucR family transcriptional regulator [Tsukamurella pulmonis]|uniref:PucR family transcriptional regulator n=1 Tax=Tsukamurella pulmonis TaxID=47312 RepID=UPI0014028CBD|nr:helix-turn-helix domain-containing protein [Tsukamurella pulmonis]
MMVLESRSTPAGDLPPSVRDLIRRAAEVVLEAPAEWLEEVDTATLTAADMGRIASDPDARAYAVRGVHMLVTHWASANTVHPGAPVTPMGDEMSDTARSMVYRGFTEASVDASRLGQNAAWRRWMRIAFDLTTDVDDLQIMLDVTSATMSEFVNASVSALQDQIKSERAQFLLGRNAERLKVLHRVLDGDEIPSKSVETVLGYRLDRRHTAAVAWSTEPTPQLSDLDRAIDAVAAQSGAGEVLRVVAGPGTVWAWLADATDVGSEALERVLAPDTRCQVALGPSRRGMDGLRTSHLDAVSTQRMLVRTGSTHHVAVFSDVEGVLLLTRSVEQADRFVTNTLGALENNHPELREVLRTYLACHGRASVAAEKLFIHRNTLLRRLQRADELLPRPMSVNPLNIGMALEIRHWREQGIA